MKVEVNWMKGGGKVSVFFSVLAASTQHPIWEPPRRAPHDVQGCVTKAMSACTYSRRGGEVQGRGYKCHRSLRRRGDVTLGVVYLAQCCQLGESRLGEEWKRIE